MNNTILTGQLICHSDDEVSAVSAFLPHHIELTLAEPGCISFSVEQSDNPRVWDVSECFQDAPSFELHQARAKASEWGRATAKIKRSYYVSGLDGQVKSSPALGNKVT
ncbi:putative quinol monooxygenase [Arthrobacter sp.]|uniref:putative quinol monooxygenase n=1 Tax=Arthrobacter sp. TaxID=1667 RepID=UPI0026DFD509|nr:antibiotic biosynthesis monooxygenase [Arthrobacter sp.]MDO5751995.1 antibiotic biosynthesis monooxygenase [Arthrobacter sp.]